MFFKVLKKDLKRSKTMNTILFLFVILASVFVSSGLSNLFSVVNGMDYFLEEALGEKDDYFVIFNPGSDESGIKSELSKAKDVKSYALDEVFSYDDQIFDGNGNKIPWYGSMMIQSPERTYIKLFDSNNKEVSSVEKGHVYISTKFLDDADLKAGDKIKLKLGKEEKEFILDDGLKDAFLGSSITGNKRILMNEEDAKQFFDSAAHGASNYYLAYIETDNIEGVNKSIAGLENVGGTFPRSTVILTRIVEMMVAFIIVILSVCLIIVSFVILKFSIGFTIQDDYREIGVMKAIGIRNFRIRRLYLVKYLAISLLGTVIGCLISFPFGNMLIKSVSKSMMLGNNYGQVINIVGALTVFDLMFMVMDKTNAALYKTQSIVYLFYTYSFTNGNKGYGAALVMVLVAFLMAITFVIQKCEKKFVFYN